MLPFSYIFFIVIATALCRCIFIVNNNIVEGNLFCNIAIYVLGLYYISHCFCFFFRSLYLSILFLLVLATFNKRYFHAFLLESLLFKSRFPSFPCRLLYKSFSLLLILFSLLLQLFLLSFLLLLKLLLGLLLVLVISFSDLLLLLEPLLFVEFFSLLSCFAIISISFDL